MLRGDTACQSVFDYAACLLIASVLLLSLGWLQGMYVFYLELVTDMLHLLVYVIFFVIVFTNYGLPLHLVRHHLGLLDASHSNRMLHRKLFWQPPQS